MVRQVLGSVLPDALTCLLLASLAVLTHSASGAVVFVSQRGLNATDFDGQISSTDLLQGLIATELPGDLGWHPANPAAGDSLNPNGLPAFTDGRSDLGTRLTGLLNDFPDPRGVPVKLIQYDLPQSIDVETIHILTGNAQDADGRIFSTTVVRYSTDQGSSFEELGYFQSDPSGSLNNENSDPSVFTADKANLVEIFDDASAVMIPGVTNLQFDFYSVDNTGGQMRDPFDGVNPFTGVDDGLTAAFVSPLLWEIDVLGRPAAREPNADFNDDGWVDGADQLLWQQGFGVDDGSAQLSDGDANGDGHVDDRDFAVWEMQFASASPQVGAAAAPEPCADWLCWAALVGTSTRRRRTKS